MKLWMAAAAVAGVLLIGAIPALALGLATHDSAGTVAVGAPQRLHEPMHRPSHRPSDWTGSMHKRIVTPGGRVWIDQRWSFAGPGHGMHRFMMGFRHGFMAGGMARMHARLFRWSRCVLRQAAQHPSSSFDPRRACGPRPEVSPRRPRG
jgi:hypothetical protein